MLKDDNGVVCAKKLTMLGCFIVATILAFLNRDINYVIVFLSLGFGNTMFVGARELLSDYKNKKN